jgi:hypothetical protein
MVRSFGNECSARLEFNQKLDILVWWNARQFIRKDITVLTNYWNLFKVRGNGHIAQGSALSLKGRYRVVCLRVGELIATTLPEIFRTTLCRVIQSMPKITSIPSKHMMIRCVRKVLLTNPNSTP